MIVSGSQYLLVCLRSSLVFCRKSSRMAEVFSMASSLGIQKYPKKSSKFITYGTAGFRDKAVELPHVLYRVGLLAALRSKLKNGGVVGVVVTASHNAECDNGAKVCDPDACMLPPAWEDIATRLANASDEELSRNLEEILLTNQIDYSAPANVFLARDTRSSSPGLAAAVAEGVAVAGGRVVDLGLLTTPQLHFVVFCRHCPAYGEPTQDGYYKKLSNAFRILTTESKGVRFSPGVCVDGANGVGALALKELLLHLPLPITLFNEGPPGILNHKCGADFVKVGQMPPEGCVLEAGRRYASLDGDADRLVYFYGGAEGAFHLLDGDKIAALFAGYFRDLIEATGLTLQMRVVQTAYANGSATHHIENKLKIPVVCVETGVKHLHHEATKHDVGVYFEANGHGTVVFSEAAKIKIKKLATSTDTSPTQIRAAQRLLSSIDLINESVGDAISDLLLVEVILQELDWSIQDWDGIYADAPSRLLKVEVPDRGAVSTEDAGRRCVSPPGLQGAIDQAVSQYARARAFVRPSGTEDVIRVYAEAHSQEEADKLAKEVGCLVTKFTNI